jgi:hypothetical protein
LLKKGERRTLWFTHGKRRRTSSNRPQLVVFPMLWRIHEKGGPNYSQGRRPCWQATK